MKKLLFTIMLFASTLAISQEFHAGFKGGLNFSNMGGDVFSDLDPRVSFHVGGFVEIPFGAKFALQPEVLYSSQGAVRGRFFGIDTEDEYDSKIVLDYLNIPLIAKFYPFEGFAIELGPQLGLLLSATEKYTDSEGSEKDDVKDFYNPLDFGVAAGVSYRLKNGIFFGIRFTKGISNINDTDFDSVPEDDFDYDYDDYENRNNVLQLSGGYAF